MLPLAPGLKLVGREVAVFFGGQIESVHINKGQTMIADDTIKLMVNILESLIYLISIQGLLTT